MYLFYKCFTMATFKVLILPHQKKDDGTYNVKIRVIHNRKVKYIRTPHYVSGSDVSKRKKNGKEELKIRNQAVLDLMDEIIVGYKKKLLPVSAVLDSWTVDRLVEFLTHDTAGFRLDFVEYWRKMADKYIADGKESTGKIYHSSLNSLIRFLGRDKLDIMEITTKFLSSFESFLRNEPKQQFTHGKIVVTGAKKKDRSIEMSLRNMKVVYDSAKYEFNDEDNGIINIPYSPFSKYRMPKSQSSSHRVLTVEQVQRIIDLPYTGRDTARDMAKDVFVLSFALMGINTADLYEVDSYDGDVLAYMRKKTRDRRSDHASMKVRVEPEIKGLLAKYKGKDKIFCFHDRHKDCKAFNRAVNAGLDKVGETIGIPELTFYYARHTMASICANILGIEIARVDEMLNHSDPKLSLARVYIEKDFKPLWEANRKLLDLFDWSFYNKKTEG